MTEHVLVGHLYGVRALRPDALHRAAHVRRALRLQPRRARVQRQERACPSDAGRAVDDDRWPFAVSGPRVSDRKSVV